MSDALVCQVDFPASFAALTGQKLADGDAPDSFNVLPALLGESRQGRDHLVEQAPDVQLYNLTDDLGETKNVAAQHPGRVQEMRALLQKIWSAGRSRPAGSG